MQIRWSVLPAALLVAWVLPRSVSGADAPLPKPAPGWSIELVEQAPRILYPTAIVAAPEGTIYLGQDPMDMPGPPTQPIDSVIAIKNGEIHVFADKLWAVMGLEWADGVLYVVHPPYLSAFRDADGDGRAELREDLVTGLGPKLPGFSGINDHVASGVRLGMDGFLYISVGDKGIPKGVGRDGAVIQLHGGGVIRVRPDGTGLEIVSTGERNPLSVALSVNDDIFTYGNDDDSKRWPNSLTHHVMGGHYGYPYQFAAKPSRNLPIMQGQLGGSGTQGICYNEDGLPAEYQGNLFFCDWGLQTVFRYRIEARGATFRVKSKVPFVTKGEVADFRPFSLAVSHDPASMYLVDWAYNGWLAEGPRTGRLYRLNYQGADKPVLPPRPSSTAPSDLIQALGHRSHRVRLTAQRSLARGGKANLGSLEAVLGQPADTSARVQAANHALWALDASETAEGRRAIRAILSQPGSPVLAQAARSCGQRRDSEALVALGKLVKHDRPEVRREAAIALGRIGEAASVPSLVDALGDQDEFVDWSVRWALREINACDPGTVAEALLDPARRESALKLCDEFWSPSIVEALTRAIHGSKVEADRARLVATLAGLHRKYPAWSGAWFGTNPLAGEFPRRTIAWDPAAMAKIQTALAESLKDPAVEVRRQAIAGLYLIGKEAAGPLRMALENERDGRCLAPLAEALGLLEDFQASPRLGSLAVDPAQPEAVRVAALDALGNLRGPQALNARITLIYDPKAPASLVARALPALGREGVVPPNDVAAFLDNGDPLVRAAALRALRPKAGRPLPADVVQSVLARLDDANLDVKRAAMDAAVALGRREAIPRLIALAGHEETRFDSTSALCMIPDPSAAAVYLSALRDRNPELRRAGEAALLAIRDRARAEIETAARSGDFEGSAALALQRILTTFRPITDWKVIGPFARTTAQVFVGEPSIDFSRVHSGVEGRSIRWTSREGDPVSGRVNLDEFKGGAGDRGGFGYDSNGSPDMAAFGYAEIPSDAERDALLLIGSSGSLIVTLNETIVHTYNNFAGRAYQPEDDLVPVRLKRGMNRLLLRSRQGIGAWCFSVRVSDPSSVSVASGARKTLGIEEMRAFALPRTGDPRNGETIFFADQGVGCVKCHAANGRGKANIGPDLTGLASKYDKVELIRSLLEPSARIATGYQPAVIATLDGKVVNGLIRAETESFIEVADGEARITRIPKAEVEDRKVGEVSVMPAGLVDALTPIEFVDLVAYLQSLAAPAAPSEPARN